MAEERGLVVRLEGRGAWVKMQRCEACGHCAAREGCHTLGGGGEVELRVENTLDAAPGDRVAVGMSDASLLKATFLVYLVPLTGLVAGAVVGDWAGPRYHLDASASAAAVGFAACALTFAVVRVVGNRWARRPSFQPRMVKIVRKSDS